MNQNRKNKEATVSLIDEERVKKQLQAVFIEKKITTFDSQIKMLCLDQLYWSKAVDQWDQIKSSCVHSVTFMLSC